LIAHRAKDLMHGLGDDIRSLDQDTALMAYLLDPAEGKYRLEDLALRYLSLEITSPDVEEGHLDLDGHAGIDETGRRAVAILRLADGLAEALAARELTDLYERVERPLVRVLAKMEDAGIRIDRGSFGGSHRPPTEQPGDQRQCRIALQATGEFAADGGRRSRPVETERATHPLHNEHGDHLANQRLGHQRPLQNSTMARTMLVILSPNESS